MRLQERQFGATSEQFPHHPNGAEVVHNETGRRGRVTAQHVNREDVNVQWKRGDVDVVPVHHLSRP